jgi:peptide-methionine (S)-S-oxide reductase
MATEQATLGGGCFWCLDAVFAQLRGVERVVSGYTGGATLKPNYEQVCTGRTGHAEVVQITFDPAVITFDDLLDIFFAMHDPTTLNRQGADAGTQYRSVIFPHNAEQEQQARAKMAALSAQGIWSDPIVTTIEPLTTFFPAEAYHQGYYANNPYQGYCQVVINPKVAKLRQKFAERLRA